MKQTTTTTIIEEMAWEKASRNFRLNDEDLALILYLENIVHRLFVLIDCVIDSCFFFILLDHL